MTSLTVFGNVHLGYVVIETEKFADWRRFGRDAIGMHIDDSLDDTVRFRLDDNECRFLLRRGPAEDVTALGWQLDDHDTFDEIVARVTKHGVPITEGTTEEAALRGVERLVRFPGPNGLAQEVFTRARPGAAPLEMATRGGFVTGEAGLGHVAITSKKPTKCAVTTTPSSTPGSPTTSTRRSAASNSRSGSCGSTSATTPWRSPRSTGCPSTRSAPASSTSTFRSPTSTT